MEQCFPEYCCFVGGPSSFIRFCLTKNYTSHPGRLKTPLAFQGVQDARSSVFNSNRERTRIPTRVQAFGMGTVIQVELRFETRRSSRNALVQSRAWYNIISLAIPNYRPTTAKTEIRTTAITVEPNRQPKPCRSYSLDLQYLTRKHQLC